MFRAVIWILAATLLVFAAYLSYEAWKPAPQGRLDVVSDPPGAEIWLDSVATGFRTGSGPLPLSPRSYSVSVKADTLAFEPPELTVTIRRGETTTVRFLARTAEDTLTAAETPAPVTTEPAVTEALPVSADTSAPVTEERPPTVAPDAPVAAIPSPETAPPSAVEPSQPVRETPAADTLSQPVGEPPRAATPR
ncbi:MAG: PEGA domain-containing protein, partial [bacterium]|nr:PEGA domain-containing protein [bacterium]